MGHTTQKRKIFVAKENICISRKVFLSQEKIFIYQDKYFISSPGKRMGDIQHKKENNYL